MLVQRAVTARLKGRREMVIGSGWYGEAFARSGKDFKTDLDYYLRPPVREAAYDEAKVMAMFRRLQAEGAAVEIHER